MKIKGSSGVYSGTILDLIYGEATVNEVVFTTAASESEVYKMGYSDGELLDLLDGACLWPGWGA